jgi:hypothetical protein
MATVRKKRITIACLVAQRGAAGRRIKRDDPDPRDPGDEEDQPPRQPGKRLRDDG